VSQRGILSKKALAYRWAGHKPAFGFYSSRLLSLHKVWSTPSQWTMHNPYNSLCNRGMLSKSGFLEVAKA
jgi:hypothetical protein